jgi:chromosome segregation ATPase
LQARIEAEHCSHRETAIRLSEHVDDALALVEDLRQQLAAERDGLREQSEVVKFDLTEQADRLRAERDGAKAAAGRLSEENYNLRGELEILYAGAQKAAARDEKARALRDELRKARRKAKGLRDDLSFERERSARLTSEIAQVKRDAKHYFDANEALVRELAARKAEIDHLRSGLITAEGNGAERERARVVAWLRGRADRCQKTNRPASASEARWNANEIEHGQHMKEGGE